jgi:acyl-CoA synthetase (NDP forming)
LRENVGFSAFVSIGSMLDVDWGDLIYYLGDDRAPRASSSTWRRSATPAAS